MNLLLFMLAGYETSSTTLSYCSFILAKFPEEQDKLLHEIHETFGESSKVWDILSKHVVFSTLKQTNLFYSIKTGEIVPTFDTIGKLTYLDMFVKEVLRMFPIVNR